MSDKKIEREIKRWACEDMVLLLAIATVAFVAGAVAATLLGAFV